MHGKLNIPAGILIGQLNKIFMYLFCLSPFKSGNGWPAQIDIQKCLLFFLIRDQGGEAGKEIFADRAKGFPKAHAHVVNNLDNIVLGNVAVAEHQCIGSRFLIVLHDKVVVLLPDTGAFFPLFCEVAVHGVDPPHPALMLDERQCILDPYITSRTTLKPVLDFPAFFSAGNVFSQLLQDRLPVSRMNAHQRVLPIERPCLLQGHPGGRCQAL